MIGNEDDIYPQTYAQSSFELDLAVKDFKQCYNRIIRLNEIEKSTQLMADEIENKKKSKCIRIYDYNFN